MLFSKVLHYYIQFEYNSVEILLKHSLQYITISYPRQWNCEYFQIAFFVPDNIFKLFQTKQLLLYLEKYY